MIEWGRFRELRRRHRHLLGLPEGDRNVFSRFIQHGGALHVSTITVGELYAWVHQAKTARRHLQGLLDLLSDLTMLPVDGDVALRFGKERAHLLDQGIQVPPT